MRLFFFPRAFTGPIHPAETLGPLCSHQQLSSGCASGILICALLPSRTRRAAGAAITCQLNQSVPWKAGKASVLIKNKIADIFINSAQIVIWAALASGVV